MASTLVFLAFIAMVVCDVVPTVTNKDGILLYSDISEVNGIDSLAKLQDLQVKYYHFKYDSVANRRQLGVLPEDAAVSFPDSIEVVKSYALPNKEDRTKPIVLPNFPVVDKNTIFMHGIMALKALSGKYNELLTEVTDINSKFKERSSDLEKVSALLQKESLSKDKEEQLLQEVQMEVEEKLNLLKLTTKEEDAKIAALFLEEEQKVMSYQAELTQQRYEAEAQIDRENSAKLLELEKQLNEANEVYMAKQRTLLEEKKVALEKELASMRSQFDIEKIKAEANSKIEQERANEDVHIRKIQTQAALDKDRLLTSIKLVAQQISQSIANFLNRPKEIAILVAGIVALVAVFYLLKELITVIREFIQKQLGKPLLVRETSYQYFPMPSFLRGSSNRDMEFSAVETYFQKVILSSELKKQVTQLAVSTRNTRISGAAYRHILLYGPPGTGKTLVARTLAASSNMDFAVMSGGDVGPLGEDAISQLHALFAWAERSTRGLLLFIDEAEAFLNARDAINTSDDTLHKRHALNALLYQTGTQSSKFALVLATNRPEDLDDAVLDRMDVSLLIDIPVLEERRQLCELYMHEHVTSVVEKSQSSLFGIAGGRCYLDDDVNNETSLNWIAKMTISFSGREISKLFIAIHHAMLLAEGRKLTYTLMQEVVKAKVKEHQHKAVFSNKSLLEKERRSESSEYDCVDIQSYMKKEKSVSPSRTKGGGRREID